MKVIKVKDKNFSLYIDSKEIDESVSKVAKEINRDLKGKNPLFIVILNGAFVFASDLIRKITIDCEISFVKLSSYSGTKTTSVVRELIGLDENLSDRHVVIVEDIIDTGITMENTINKFKKLNAKDVKIATLLFKPNSFLKDYNIDYIGLKIPNDFIVGYGLDYDGFGRNYPDIYKIVD
ncbi:MAG: hypoxanthine phosphoribosyltransferase [Bacteroidales bacterium]|nr:hypoxanthine phosphoribosyltransferase [Bacteroidales bacterium]